jgi:hypothetical protein
MVQSVVLTKYNHHQMASSPTRLNLQCKYAIPRKSSNYVGFEIESFKISKKIKAVSGVDSINVVVKSDNQKRCGGKKNGNGFETTVCGLHHTCEIAHARMMTKQRKKPNRDKKKNGTVAYITMYLNRTRASAPAHQSQSQSRSVFLVCAFFIE